MADGLQSGRKVIVWVAADVPQTCHRVIVWEALTLPGGGRGAKAVGVVFLTGL